MKYILFLSIVISSLSQESKNPYFYSDDIEFYKFNDPSYSCVANVDEAFLWNFHQLVTPCYKKINLEVSPNKEIQLRSSDGSADRYRLDSRNSIKLFEERAIDPFYGQMATMHYKKGIVVIKNKMEINANWTVTDQVIFKMKLPTSFSDNTIYANYDSIQLETRLILSAKVEAINKLYLPINSRRVTLVSYKKKWEITGISVGDKDSWYKLSKEAILNQNGKMENKLSYEWKYLSKEKPHVLAEIDFDESYHCTNFDFYHTSIPKTLSFCNRNVENVFLFPNPSFGEVNLLFENMVPGNYDLVVFNVIGTEIDRIQLETDGDQLHNVDLTRLPKGTYLYTVLDKLGKRLITKKLVILSV